MEHSLFIRSFMDTRTLAWTSTPLASFKEFVRTQDFVSTNSRRRNRPPVPLSEASATVYTHMFSAFATWMAARDKTIVTLDEHDLLAFVQRGIDGKNTLNSKIAYRYLRLIERCQAHLQLDTRAVKHAIGALLQGAGRRGAADQDMVALDDGQRARYIDELVSAAATPNGGEAIHAWKRRRDRAMQLLMLCAGVRVAEAVGLLVEEIGRQPDLDGSLAVNLTPEAKHATSHGHATRVDAAAVPALLAWLAERAALRIPGRLLFPANLTGTPLHKATVYRQVKASLARADIAVTRSGGRTLRNSFAVHTLRQGVGAAALTDQLGLALPRSTDTYTLAAAKQVKAAGAKS
ncbi:integrase/recombinase XerD [Oxalobacteraceae bacterium GrIS 1.11]